MMFIYPIMNSLPWIIVTHILYILSIVLWAMSTFKDPGFLKKSEKIEFITLVEKFEPG
jgi:uncharacterized membrane protein YwzB